MRRLGPFFPSVVTQHRRCGVVRLSWLWSIDLYIYMLVKTKKNKKNNIHHDGPKRCVVWAHCSSSSPSAVICRCRGPVVASLSFAVVVWWINLNIHMLAKEKYIRKNLPRLGQHVVWAHWQSGTACHLGVVCGGGQPIYMCVSS